jgi:D-alanyl-D-alanine carboxypeptidase
VLGGRTAATRDRLMARLLDDGFENQETPAELVAQVGTVPAAAKGGRRSSAKATAVADATPASRRHHRRSKADAVATRSTATCSKKKAVTCPAPKATARKVASVGSSPDK